MDIRTLNAHIAQESAFVDALWAETGRVIVGQRPMLERILIGLLCNGHILLEGMPGLAKTLSIRTFADAIEAQFARIQFTPDLLPADVVGTVIYNQQTASFAVRKGPVFANVVLADEINRAPAKVQSALLEAMQERQVTIGTSTHPLPSPFLVLATQNPIEQEGTYALPEAQLDRFLLKVKVTYPSRAEEKEVMNRMSQGPAPRAQKVIGPGDITRARQVLTEIYVDEKVKDYILDVVQATREPARFELKELQDALQYGASPRATLALLEGARAHAFLRHRGFVTPDDVKAIGPDVLRHRIGLSYEAEAEALTADRIIQRLFERIEVP